MTWLMTIKNYRINLKSHLALNKSLILMIMNAYHVLRVLIFLQFKKAAELVKLEPIITNKLCIVKKSRSILICKIQIGLVTSLSLRLKNRFNKKLKIHYILNVLQISLFLLVSNVSNAEMTNILSQINLSVKSVTTGNNLTEIYITVLTLRQIIKQILKQLQI